MLPPGQAYERWILATIYQIVDALGFDISDSSINIRASLAGRSQRHEIDVVAEDGNRLILIECKDHHTLKNRELLDAYYSFVDIAAANPLREIIAFVVSSTDVSESGQKFIHHGAPRNFIIPPNLARIGLVNLAPREVADSLLLYDYHITGLRIHVLTRPPVTEVSPVELMYSGSLPVRLRACLAIIRDGRQANLLLPAQIEAATSLLHVGLSADARRFANASTLLAQRESNRLHYEASISIAAMSAFQDSLTRRGRARYPGRRSINRLASLCAEFDDHHQASALGFLGAWNMRYGDRTVAMEMLRGSRQHAQRMQSAQGYNLMFLSDFRRAESVDGAQREDLLHRAMEFLPFLDSRNAEVADELVRRITVGEDSSIESRFHSGTITDLIHRELPRRPA